ncbi:conserved hypothetical protein [Rubrivivax sp. A210]|uniref:carboxypeptidase-like regulatory domain-containing protein n=1 Tax=Rubrivivax sp. A210 TaxID=2772301 RepID=UPI00191B5991|nr:carboxypeptidase-like regulatory domain-containing protein [Rubrivivax sp. A210]CAD5370209.1 conserved hypothetical protein [Rubrivivax sp. A210]
MTQLGEGALIGLFPSTPTPSISPGSLVVAITESSSDEAIEDVKVTLAGPSSGSARTDAAGECRFDGIGAGNYQLTLVQDEFELRPDSIDAVVEPGQTRRLELRLKRVITTIVMKRKHVKASTGALWAAARRKDPSGIDYGHWWVEIDDSESYGWWPASPVGLEGTLGGVQGVVNMMEGAGGTSTRDPHHGDPGDEEFSPRVKNGKSAAFIKQSMRDFVAGFETNYGSVWRWPMKYNCHSFQEQMMSDTNLSWWGSKKLK